MVGFCGLASQSGQSGHGSAVARTHGSSREAGSWQAHVMERRQDRLHAGVGAGRRVGLSADDARVVHEEDQRAPVRDLRREEVPLAAG